MLKIEPIKLLRGCHSHTGQTGQGCFLNVCSYLQGDSVITDKPSSVHPALRGPLLGINDALPDEFRQRLIPFVHRAMLTGDNPSPLSALPALLTLAQFAQGVFKSVTRFQRDYRRHINVDVSRLGGVASVVERGISGLNLLVQRPEEVEHLGAAIGVLLSNSLEVLGGYEFRGVQAYDEPTLSIADYKVGAPLQAHTMKAYYVFDRVVDSLIDVLDAVLPRDMEPTTAVAKRAADLALARASWGDKPLPANPKAKSKDDWYFGQFDSFSIVESKFDPGHFGTFALHTDVPPEMKANKPHGPLKKHKPAYF